MWYYSLLPPPLSPPAPSLFSLKIRRQFDEGDDVDIPEDANPHDVACLFKEFFRSLPEPLMTRDLYYPLLQTRSEWAGLVGGV